LWRVPFLGAPPRKLIDKVSSAVGWSPDGRHMAFIRQQTRIGVTELVVADEDGRGERTLATRRLPLQFLSIANGPVPPSSAPAWTPDGRAIAGCGSSGANSDIVVVDATTGATRIVHIAGGTVRAMLAVVWMDGDSLIGNGRLG